MPVVSVLVSVVPPRLAIDRPAMSGRMLREVLVAAGPLPRDPYVFKIGIVLHVPFRHGHAEDPDRTSVTLDLKAFRRHLRWRAASGSRHPRSCGLVTRPRHSRPGIYRVRRV